jgi:hypothetical protein
VDTDCRNKWASKLRPFYCYLRLKGSERELGEILTFTGRMCYLQSETGEILVKLKDGTDEKTIQAIQRELHLETIRLVSRPNLYLMKILDGSSDETVMQRLRNYEGVILSEQNYVVTIY